MSSEDKVIDSIGCGVSGTAVDTSWIDEPAVSVPTGGGSSGGGVSRGGRGDGKKRRSRRRTLSPSIGKHNYMSNVDFNDPMNFPTLPSSENKKTSSVSAGENDAVSSTAPLQVDTGSVGLSASAVVSSSPKSSLGAAGKDTHAAGKDADLPDPTVVAGLFDVEGTTSPVGPTRALPLGVLGPLGNNEAVVASSSSVARIKAGRKKQQQQQSLGGGRQGSSLTASQGAAAATGPSRGRSSRRATFGGADARIFFEAENLEPILPTRPPAPAVVAAAAAAATKAAAAAAATEAATAVTIPPATISPSSEVGRGQAPDLPFSAAAASVLPVDDEGEERGDPPPPPPPPQVAKQKSRSRSSRRRSIVMPSEARPLMDTDLDDVGANDAKVSPDGDTAAGAAATAEPMAPAGEAKPSRDLGSSTSNSNGEAKNPAEELPLSSINATTCLSRSLAVQRGWAAGDETTRKDLFRAFYAAEPGSQRARRIAARLFCLTGYPLSPMAPEDARVLCEAAGDSLDWGLGETVPRLVSRPIRRDTRDQKRKLVLRIKPIFDLMEKASKDDKLQAEAATGVVARKASPDGFCYENRETGKPVDPDAYKVPYLKHVQAARVSRLREFATRRVVAPATLLGAGSGSSSTAGKSASSSAKIVLPSSASESADGAAEEEIVSREGGDLAPSPTGMATEEPPKERQNLVGASGGAGEDAPLGEIADGVTVAVAEGVVGAERIASEVKIEVPEVENTPPSGVSAGAGPTTPGTTTPGKQEVAREAATTSPAALETPIAVEAAGEAALVVGVREKLEDEKAMATVGAERPIAVEASASVSPAKREGDMVAETGAEDTEVAREASGYASLGMPGAEVKVPCSGAAGGACSFDSSPQNDSRSPCAAVVAVAAECSPARRPEEHSTASARGDTAAVSPLDHAGLQTPGASGPGNVSGSEAQSPHFPGSPSPVLAIERTTRLITTSEERNAPFGDEDVGGSGQPVGFGNDQDGSPETAFGGQVVSGSTPSAHEGVPSSTVSSGRGAAVPESLFGESRNGRAASPPVGAEAFEQQQEGSLMPSAGRQSQRASPSQIFSLLSASFNAGSPAAAAAELAVGSGLEDGEDAGEIAALEERLWAAIDAAFREYHDGVSLVRSRRNNASTPSAPAQAKSENTHRPSTDDASSALPPRETRATSTARSTPRREEFETTAPNAMAGSPTEVGVTTTVTPTDGMPTPDSPLLPLLQLRLSEEEEDGLFEFSSSWRGAVGGSGGGGSSQVRSGKPRRRSLAKAFSSQEPREEPKVGAAPVTSKPETSTDRGEHRTAVVMCRLCCRKACDTVLRPCEHSACGVCVEKLRVQAERSGQPFSCPWDRQPVDETSSL